MFSTWCMTRSRLTFLHVARAKGILCDSLESKMFVQQAARQFEIWTGKPAPAGDMLRAVYDRTLQDRAAAISLNPSRNPNEKIPKGCLTKCFTWNTLYWLYCTYIPFYL